MTPEELRRKISNSPEGKGVAGRTQVRRLAQESPEEALKFARKIEHPWYRCQALAIIAKDNQKHPTTIELLEESLLAAYSQDEPSRVASVAYWPLAILATTNPNIAAFHTQKPPHGLRYHRSHMTIFITGANSLLGLLLRAIAPLQ